MKGDPEDPDHSYPYLSHRLLRRLCADLTLFDRPIERERRGTHSIVRTALRVAGRDALDYWTKRLDEAGAKHGPVREVDGRRQLDFEDPEGQRLALVDDGGAGPSHRASMAVLAAGTDG